LTPVDEVRGDGDGDDFNDFETNFKSSSNDEFSANFGPSAAFDANVDFDAPKVDDGFGNFADFEASGSNFDWAQPETEVAGNFVVADAEGRVPNLDNDDDDDDDDFGEFDSADVTSAAMATTAISQQPFQNLILLVKIFIVL
jgi:hypothetical protein